MLRRGRESVSLDLMSSVSHREVEHGVDAAWLVDQRLHQQYDNWLDVAAQQKAVALPCVNWLPFDSTRHPQQAYEKALPGWSIAFSLKAIDCALLYGYWL